MNPQNVTPDVWDYEGRVTAGRATGRPIPPPSEEDLRHLEEARNHPTFYARWKDDGFVSSNWIVKPVIDPNRLLFLTVEEIGSLPRGAQVALAARCARRVLPIIRRFSQESVRFVIRPLVDGVSVAEGELVVKDQYEAEEHAQAAVSVVGFCISEASGSFSGAYLGQIGPGLNRSCLQSPADSVQAAAYAAVEAVRSYASARARGASLPTDPYAGDYAEVAIRAAVRAVSASIQSLFQVVTLGTLNHLTAPARDFERLRVLAQKEQWTDDTPVPPSVFGPMWEGPPPEWWTDEPLAEPMPPLNGEPQPTPTDDAVAPH